MVLIALAHVITALGLAFPGALHVIVRVAYSIAAGTVLRAGGVFVGFADVVAALNAALPGAALVISVVANPVATTGKTLLWAIHVAAGVASTISTGAVLRAHAVLAWVTLEVAAQ